jgi:hypothetical protein
MLWSIGSAVASTIGGFAGGSLHKTAYCEPAKRQQPHKNKQPKKGKSGSFEKDRTWILMNAFF